MSARISRIILFVTDVAKVAAFYQSHFGLEPIGPEEDGWLELRAEGCNLALHRGTRAVGTGSHSAAKIVFAVSNVHEALAEFAKTGLKFGQVLNGMDSPLRTQRIRRVIPSRFPAGVSIDAGDTSGSFISQVNLH